MTIRQQQWVGLVVGILFPLVVFAALYLVNHTHISFSSYMAQLAYRSMLSKVLALCVLPNLVVFYLLLWFHRDWEARGVVLATVLMAVLVAVLYFVY